MRTLKKKKSRADDMRCTQVKNVQLEYTACDKTCGDRRKQATEKEEEFIQTEAIRLVSSQVLTFGLWFPEWTTDLLLCGTWTTTEWFFGGTRSIAPYDTCTALPCSNSGTTPRQLFRSGTTTALRRYRESGSPFLEL